MDNEPKIDYAKIFAWKIAEPFKEFGQEELDHVVRCLREYRTEIEKEFTERDKRQLPPKEHDNNNGYVAGFEKMDVSVEKGHLSQILSQTTERIFDNPEEIKED